MSAPADAGDAIPSFDVVDATSAPEASDAPLGVELPPVVDAERPLDASAPDAQDAMVAPAGDTLEVVVFRLPDNTPADAAVHLAGNVNGWNPADPALVLAPRAGGAWSLRLHGLAPGQRVEFKFTRGAWSNVERDDGGADIANRVVTFDPARPTVALYVERWADLAAPATTRSGSVSVLLGVAIPQLGTARNVWIYRPPGYVGGTERYAVTYMFDAQNLFDARTSSFGREWRVDEALEAAFYEGRLPGIIVVGVENSAQRGCEYNVFTGDPHPACSAGSALGDETVAFLVDTLKPRIDREYRTLPDRTHTAVAGSSMGGSMAVRTAFLHPDVFSRVAALSPSYQNTLAATPQMPAFVAAQRPTLPFRFHQDVGDAEVIRDIPASVLVRNMNAVHDAARAAGVPDADDRARVVAGATHDEGAWSARIAEVLSWLWAP